MNTTVKNVKRTKQYKAFIAAGLNEDAAIAAYNTVNGIESEPTVDPRIQLLIEGGLTQEQAVKVLADNDAAEAEKAPEEPVQTAKEQQEALVASRGLAFTKGRVYVTPSIIEAQVRVLKTGSPEIVQGSGQGRVHSVLIFRTDSGDAAIQNLVKPV